jgi:hypothetical protein
MSTVNRTIETDNDKIMASKLIEGRPMPFTISITDGKSASTKQNKTQFMWFKEISEQKGDTTAQEVRAYCKLVIGVPILRDQNEAFRIRYDEVLKPLSYEMKLSIMGEPFNLPVTSLMSTKQMSEYMDAIFRHFSSQGVILTIPEDTNYHSGSLPPSEPDNTDGSPPSVEAGDSSPSLPASPIEDDMRGQLIAFTANLVGIIKNSQLPYKRQLYACEQAVADWKYAISEAGHAKMDSISVGAEAVIHGKRTLTQFINYVATDLLDCTATEIGG